MKSLPYRSIVLCSLLLFLGVTCYRSKPIEESAQLVVSKADVPKTTPTVAPQAAPAASPRKPLSGQTDPGSALASRLCHGAMPGSNGVILTNFQLIRNEIDLEGEDHLVGCVINQGKRSVTIHKLAYTVAGESAGFDTISLNMGKKRLVPGQRFPWRSGFFLDDHADIIYLSSLTVSWENGETEEIKLTRSIN
ncbi:MAG: hypothetical protein AAGF01_07035 [Cyanobacteria bacterium P01_G01_bin.38]